MEDVIESPNGDKIAIDQSNNMMSVIEVPSIDAGEYELEISVSKFLYLTQD